MMSHRLVKDAGRAVMIDVKIEESSFRTSISASLT